MKNSRRIKRMSRNRVTVPKMNITSLMDIFTILVFFLLVNSATTEVLETPKQIKLPASVVEEKPRETVVIFISPEDVTVQGESVARTADILTVGSQNVESIAARLRELNDAVIGINTKTIIASQEVTILADRTVPFAVIKTIMSTCTSEGYAKISLAVFQKAPESALAQN